MDGFRAEPIVQVFRQRMLPASLDRPNQLPGAVWRVDSPDGLPRQDFPGGLLVCGMGGSAVGGELASAAIGRRARRPIRIVRDYAIDAWVGPETLVLCSSYSGDTEETLACYEAAGTAGAPRVAVTTGGALAAAARRDGVPVIGVPGGFQPRAAVAYGTVAVLECAAACGAGPPLRDEVAGASMALEARVAEWGPDAPEDSGAKALARALAGKLPLIYGAGPTVAVASRWKTQLNENAKVAAFSSALPEADHNEICGYEDPAAGSLLSTVFLDDEGVHGRTRRRIEVTAELARAAGFGVERIAAEGRDPLERVLTLVLLGDLVSLYLAVLLGRDPTPVDAISQLKGALADR